MTVRLFNYENVTLKVTQDGTHCWVEGLDGEPWAKLSVDAIYLPKAPIGCFWLKTWSENRNITASMAARGILQLVGEPYAVSQWVAAVAAKVVPE